jgi:hypothetical protein
MMKKILLRVGACFFFYILFVAVLIFIDSTIVNNKVPVSMPSMIIYGDDEIAYAKGTWIIEGGSKEGNYDAFPLQTSTIQCNRSKKECIIATGYVGSSSNKILTVDLDVLPIIEWTDNHLVYINDSFTCLNYRYTLNWTTKSATGIRLKIPKMKNQESCKEYEEELRLTLKAGYEVYEDEKKKRVHQSLKDCLILLSFGQNCFE